MAEIRFSSAKGLHRAKTIDSIDITNLGFLFELLRYCTVGIWPRILHVVFVSVPGPVDGYGYRPSTR